MRTVRVRVRVDVHHPRRVRHERRITRVSALSRTEGKENETSLAARTHARQGGTYTRLGALANGRSAHGRCRHEQAVATRA